MTAAVGTAPCTGQAPPTRNSPLTGVGVDRAQEHVDVAGVEAVAGRALVEVVLVRRLMPSHARPPVGPTPKRAVERVQLDIPVPSSSACRRRPRVELADLDTHRLCMRSQKLKS